VVGWGWRVCRASVRLVSGCGAGLGWFWLCLRWFGADRGVVVVWGEGARRG